MDKIELLKKLRDEKWELYNMFDENGEKEMANAYYWECSALTTAINILLNEEYYEYRKSAYNSK